MNTNKLGDGRGYITTTQAAQRVPGGVDPSTVHRWITRGVRGRRLPAVRVGNRWKVKASDLAQFIAAGNQGDRSAEAVIEAAEARELLRREFGFD